MTRSGWNDPIYVVSPLSSLLSGGRSRALGHGGVDGELLRPWEVRGALKVRARPETGSRRRDNSGMDAAPALVVAAARRTRMLMKPCFTDYSGTGDGSKIA